MQKDINKILRDLINISSYDKVDENHPIINYLEKELSSCQEILKVKDEMGKCHLLVGANTNLHNVSNAFLFSGHIDTVPQSDGHTPICIENNESMFGLGSSDMKGFVASLIVNIENFKRINKPIIFSLTSDEETDFYGIESILSVMKARNIVPEAVIVGEPTSSKFAYSHRGNSIFLSKVIGKACHSSTPELGINAINLSMEAIESIEKCINVYKDEASICITKIEGGKACNIVPDLCTTTISVRTSSNKSLQNIFLNLQNIYDRIGEKAIGTEICNIFNIPPFENVKQGKFRSVSPQAESIDFMGASEAGFIQQAFPDIDMVIYGPGDPNCIHKAGEKISKKELSQYAESLSALISKYNRIQKECDNVYGL